MIILAVVLAVFARAALMVGYGFLSPPITDKDEKRIGLLSLSLGGLLLVLAATLALAAG